MTKQGNKKFFWVDLEMTGLDEKVDTILEVAAVITDTDLNIIEEYQSVVFQPQEVLDKMNAWCKEHHGKSGLTAEVPNGKLLETVEKDLLVLIAKHFSAQDKPVMSGNSIANDQRFIVKYMPDLTKRLHYRLIDVSSFKEVYRERYGIKYEKKNAHRASGDILESINELKHYLSFVTIPK